MSLPPVKKANGLPPPKKSAPIIPKRTLYRASEQDLLFNVDTKWEEEWKGMPEFISKDMMPFHTVHVHFASLEAIKDFSERIGQKINTEIKEVKYTPTVWHPKRDNLKIAHLRYKSKNES